MGVLNNGVVWSVVVNTGEWSDFTWRSPQNPTILQGVV